MGTLTTDDREKEMETFWELFVVHSSESRMADCHEDGCDDTYFVTLTDRLDAPFFPFLCSSGQRGTIAL